nr:helix-turn-helix domain-containing protein [Flavobacterium sp.]
MKHNTNLVMYSTKQLADKLSVTKETVSNLVKRGEITPINEDKNYFIFAAKDVEAIILKRQKNG